MIRRHAVRALAPALRTLRVELDEAAAVALLAFLHGSLADDPRAVGRALERERDGLWAAERGDCTVYYVIDDERRIVTVTSIEPRPWPGRITPGR